MCQSEIGDKKGRVSDWILYACLVSTCSGKNKKAYQRSIKCRPQREVLPRYQHSGGMFVQGLNRYTAGPLFLTYPT